MLIPTASSSLVTGGAAAAFDPITELTWMSAFWAEGPLFQTKGYGDTDSVTAWPDEVASVSDATNPSTAPVYVAADSNFNSKPSVRFSGNTAAMLQTGTFTARGGTMVIVGRIVNTGWSTLIDGTGASNRRTVQRYIGSPGNWYLNSGSNLLGGTPDASPHLFRARHGSSGYAYLFVDETSIMSGTSGTQSITGYTFGNYLGGGFPCNEILFFGHHADDPTAESKWPDFKSWITSHYGITLA